MKILHVIEQFKPAWDAGGMARVCYEISKCQVKNGHDVTIYTTDGFTFRLDVEKNKPVDVNGATVYYFRNISMFLIKVFGTTTPYYFPFVAKKKIKDFDIIHIHAHRTPFVSAKSNNNLARISQSNSDLIEMPEFNQIFKLISGEPLEACRPIFHS